MLAAAAGDRRAFEQVYARCCPIVCDFIAGCNGSDTPVTDTRTAAYLRVTVYPVEAQWLLADGDHFADYLAPLVPDDVSTAAAWTAELARHVAAAQRSLAAAQKLLTGPAPEGCASPAATVAGRLATDLAVLRPEGDDSPHSGAPARSKHREKQTALMTSSGGQFSWRNRRPCLRGPRALPHTALPCAQLLLPSEPHSRRP